MAFRDYITCGECETKIIYDGYDNGRNRLEEIWGDPNANSWTVHLLCPDCIKKMRADLAAARADLSSHETLLLSARNLFDPYGDGRLNDSQSACKDVCARIDAALAGEKK